MLWKQRCNNKINRISLLLTVQHSNFWSALGHILILFLKYTKQVNDTSCNIHWQFNCIFTWIITPRDSNDGKEMTHCHIIFILSWIITILSFYAFKRKLSLYDENFFFIISRSINKEYYLNIAKININIVLLYFPISTLLWLDVLLYSFIM